MEEGVQVSIVIPAYQAGDRIGAVVGAARNQDWKGGGIEVVVVDDGSADDTAERARGAGARVLTQENRGPAAARNRGWREARGEWIFFTDSDCIPAPDWISRMLPLLEEKSVGAVGGSYAIANPGSLLASCIHEEITLRHEKMGGEVRFLGSFNLALPRKVLEEVGGFTEEYRHASGEDNDLSYRIRKRGYRLLFEPKSTVAHTHPERFGSYLKEQARHGYWRMKLYRDHPERMEGDDYSGFSDFLEPPAALAVLLLLPWRGTVWARALSNALLVLLFLTALIPTVAVVLSTGRGAHTLFLGVRFLRSFARAVGMAAGVAMFWAAPAVRRLWGGRA